MAFTVEKLADVPAVVSRLHPNFDMQAEQLELQANVREHLEAAPEPLFYIVDLTQHQLNISDIMQGANTGARSDESIWRHENIREVIFVSPDKTVQRAVAGLNSDVFGNFQAETFNTMGEALAFLRQAA